MSTDVVTYARTVVPDQQVTQYVEQQRTGRTPEQQQKVTALDTFTKHLTKLRDAHPSGLVRSDGYRQQPVVQGAYLRVSTPLAGMKFEPQELTLMLEVCNAVDPTHAHKDFVYAVLTEMGRRLGK